MSRGWIGRGLALAGAGLITWSVASRAWWSYSGGSELFEDMSGRLGPYHGTWCSAPFCHDLEMKYVGAGYGTVGSVVFSAGLIAAAALIMAALAAPGRIRVLGRAAIGLAAFTAAAMLVLVTRLGSMHGAAIELGAGLPLGLAGVAVGIAGCVLALRSPALPATATRVHLGRALTLVACAAALIAVFGRGFWHWSWSDERNAVGLRETQRCWVHPDRTICSDVESVAEIFMGEPRDQPRFAKIAAQTYDAGLVAAFIAIALLIGPLASARNRWMTPLVEHGHLPWIVLGLYAYATAALTPDLGTARDVHFGWGFVLLGVACVLGIVGHLLGRAPVPDVSPPAAL